MTRFMKNDESLGAVHLYTSLDDRILRVRRQKRNKLEHQCEYCKSVIEAGNGSYYITGMSAGRFYNFHTCLNCYEE